MVRIPALFAVMEICWAALDVSPNTAEDIIDNLRSHIFVDSRHVSAREETSCDSLSGPFCDGPPGLKTSGVIPSEYVGNLQINFDVLHQALPLDLWKFNYTSLFTDTYSLPIPNNLILKDLPDGGKVTSHYSLSLPSGSGLAKLEGRWLLEDTVSMETFLPAYIKFSEPVMVKRLWAELTLPSDLDGQIKPVVILAFRLGTETVWTTEAILDHGFTMDVTSRGADGHGPLRACDQIVIFSTVRGLKIVSIEFEHSQEEVLVPTLLLVPGRDGSLMFKNDKVNARAITGKQVISIKEAIQNGYKLNFPIRASVTPTQALAELVAKDIGAIAPIEQVLQAVKGGELKLPHELKKAILKHEKDLTHVVEEMTERAIKALVSNEGAEHDSRGSDKKQSRRHQSISDLFIAALMHL